MLLLLLLLIIPILSTCDTYMCIWRTVDITFVECVDVGDQYHICRCKEGFDGDATWDNQCFCDSPKYVYYVGDKVYCLLNATFQEEYTIDEEYSLGRISHVDWGFKDNRWDEFKSLIVVSLGIIIAGLLIYGIINYYGIYVDALVALSVNHNLNSLDKQIGSNPENEYNSLYHEKYLKYKIKYSNLKNQLNKNENIVNI